MSYLNNLKLNDNAYTVIKILEIIFSKNETTSENLKIDINLLKDNEEYLIQIINSHLYKDEYFDIILMINNQFDDKIIFKIEKEFHYIELKKKLNEEYLEEFQELILNKIHALKKLNLNVKFTFLRDSIFLHNDDDEFKKDNEICHFVSSALINIVKQSQREEFRSRTFNLFNVNSYEELQFSIKRHLLSQIDDKITNKPSSDE